VTTCGSCHAPIRWALTLAGKPIPLDPDPRPDGNLVVIETADWNGLPLARPAELGDPPDGPRYVTHFATCPDADTHRRPVDRPAMTPPTTTDEDCPSCEGSGVADFPDVQCTVCGGWGKR